MTQKTTPEGQVYFCEFCGRDNFKSRQAAAAHEKVCGKNPAVCPQPAPAKVEQVETLPAKDEQTIPLSIPEPSSSGTENGDGKSDSSQPPSRLSSGKSSQDIHVLSGDEPALPYGLIVIIFIVVGAGIALYMFRDAIVSVWEQIFNGGDENGKQPPAATI